MNAFIARTPLAPRHVYRQVKRLFQILLIDEPRVLTSTKLQFAATHRKMHIKSIPMCMFSFIQLHQAHRFSLDVPAVLKVEVLKASPADEMSRDG